MAELGNSKITDQNCKMAEFGINKMAKIGISKLAVYNVHSVLPRLQSSGLPRFSLFRITKSAQLGIVKMTLFAWDCQDCKDSRDRDCNMLDFGITK